MSPANSTTRLTVTENLKVVILRANAAADRVGSYLRNLGLTPPPGKTRRLPGWFLIDLGSALQLLEWERSGVTDLLPGLFPPAEEFLLDTWRAVRDPVIRRRRPDEALARRIMTTNRWHLAHADRVQFPGVVVDAADEEALADSLARFLWDMRHADALN
ncbi:hypothetical protein [Zavarzinella formosa]|uniref:hypothetical protein n=1 Tax=Zavarzinella formosa TaxID=360055 RepID=UPI0002E2FF20|nr:hypothetical protein [Zavarzinella formosa]